MRCDGGVEEGKALGKSQSVHLATSLGGVENDYSTFGFEDARNLNARKKIKTALRRLIRFSVGGSPPRRCEDLINVYKMRSKN